MTPKCRRNIKRQALPAYRLSQYQYVFILNNVIKDRLSLSAIAARTRWDSVGLIARIVHAFAPGGECGACTCDRRPLGGTACH
jgi:hypothetical protein